MNVINNMKNRYFTKYYYEKSYQLDDLYIKLIQNLTVLYPTFNETLSSVFSEIEKKREEYLGEKWVEKTNDVFYNYYSTEFPKLFSESYFDLLKNNITEEYNIPYLKEIIDTVIDNLKSSSDFSNSLNIILNYLTLYIQEYDFDIDISNITKKKDSDIIQILKELDTKDNSEQNLEILEEYENIKQKYYSQINLEYNGDELDEKMSDYIKRVSEVIYNTDDDLDSIVKDILDIGNVEVDIDTIPNFMAIAYNQSNNYYMEVFKLINEFYNTTIQNMNNFTLFNGSDEIDDKFGELWGYALIDKKDYFDPPCPKGVCHHKFDLKKIKEEKKKDLASSRRRLKSSPFTKEVKEVVRVLNEMRDIIKDDPDIRQEVLNNTKRRLATAIDFEISTNYGRKSPEREKKHVEKVTSDLKSALDGLNENFYIVTKNTQLEIIAKFNDELNGLVDIYSEYLNKFKNLLGHEAYYLLETNITSYMYKLENYVTKMTGTLTNLTSYYIGYVYDVYISHLTAGSMISSKVLNYYDILESQISSRFETYDMSLNQALQSNELNNEQIKKVVGVLESLIIGTAEVVTTVEVDMKSQYKPLFGFTSGDDETPEIMQGAFNDYDWDDDDDDNSGIENDENSFMYKREKTKKEEKKSDSDNKETKSGFVKKAEELKQKMADLGLKAETEIKFNLENWSEISINNNFVWELKKEIKAGWQHPFCFPAVPIFQIRVGFKYSVYFRLSIGLQVTFENKDDTGPELTIKSILK